MTFSTPWRKLILTLHVISSVGFIGAVAGFLALAIAGTVSQDGEVVRGAYIAMALITWSVIVPLAFTSLVIGVVQSLGTPWGLFRYYWVIVKLALSLLAAVVLMLQTESINNLADVVRGTDLVPGQLFAARVSLIVHASGGLIVLLVATVLSVYKPRGTTRYGARRIAERTPA